MRKKGLLTGWIAGVLLLLFTACSGTYTCTDLLSAAEAACAEYAGADLRIYFEGGTDLNSLTADRSEQLYDGMDPIPLCDDYAVCLSGRDRIFEIHIFRLASSNRASELAKILQRRIDLLQSPDVYLYDPVGYEQVVSSAAVYTRGKYVCLLVTPDNDAVWKEIKGRI